MAGDVAGLVEDAGEAAGTEVDLLDECLGALPGLVLGIEPIGEASDGVDEALRDASVVVDDDVVDALPDLKPLPNQR